MGLPVSSGNEDYLPVGVPRHLVEVSHHLPARGDLNSEATQVQVFRGQDSMVNTDPWGLPESLTSETVVLTISVIMAPGPTTLAAITDSKLAGG